MSNTAFSKVTTWAVGQLFGARYKTNLTAAVKNLLATIMAANPGLNEDAVVNLGISQLNNVIVQVLNSIKVPKAFQPVLESWLDPPAADLLRSLYKDVFNAKTAG